MTDPQRIAVIQDGARLHYAVPAALHKTGRLARAYTNWYDAPGTTDRLLARLIGLARPREAQRLHARFSADLPADKVVSNPWHALRASRARKRFSSDEDFFRWESEQFALWVERRGLGDADALFGFVRNIAPRLLAFARSRGLLTVVDQIIAPRVIELAQERVQHDRFPGWSAAPPPPAHDGVVDLEQATWAQADRITCASEYVRTGLRAAGVAAPVSVVPYPLDTRLFPRVDRRSRTGPFVVGFVGAVGLRKGAPYFFEVAKRLAGPQMQFEMVGPVQLSPHGRAQCGPVVLSGSIPRDEVPAALARFDAFLFPSTCEGSAQVLSEAMASGLPVVCSENSGSPETARIPAHCIRFDDIDGYCASLLACVARRHEPPEVLTPPTLEDYAAGLLQALV